MDALTESVREIVETALNKVCNEAPENVVSEILHVIFTEPDDNIEPSIAAIILFAKIGYGSIAYRAAQKIMEGVRKI